MFSRLQAAFPILAEDVPVDRWVKKIFPWKTDREISTTTVLDNRECYRLDLENIPPLDATLVSQNGTIIDIHLLDLSAGGLSGTVSSPEPLYKGQVVTLVFVLPLEDLTLIKTEASLILVNPQDPESTILHMQFAKTLDSRQRDLIHGFIVSKQLEMIRQLKGWGMS
jgi:c-di-GMP-binding flagellar brake protein YcgR